MPGAGDSADTTQTSDGAVKETDTEQAPGEGGAEAADCNNYVDELVDLFAGQFDYTRLTVDAQHHLERTATWLVCYSFETSNSSNPNWWEYGEDGGVYWRRHARQLARRLNKILDKIPPGTLIDGKRLDEEIDDYGKRFLAWLERRLNSLDLSELAGLKEDIERSDFPEEARPDRLDQLVDGEAEQKQEWIREILTGCPFLRKGVPEMDAQGMS